MEAIYYKDLHASVVADLVSGSWAILEGSTVRKI